MDTTYENIFSCHNIATEKKDKDKVIIIRYLQKTGIFWLIQHNLLVNFGTLVMDISSVVIHNSPLPKKISVYTSNMLIDTRSIDSKSSLINFTSPCDTSAFNLPGFPPHIKEQKCQIIKELRKQRG